MKNKILISYRIFLWCILFLFVSCSDDDASPIPEPNLIDTSVISEDFNYSLKFKTILNSQMSYVDVGSGEHTFVLLHGKSGKPDIDYSFETHYQYLNEFLEEMDLENVILVIHDWGSGLGFHWANNHQSKVKGIAFFEAMVASYDTMEDWFGSSSGDPMNPSLADIMTLFRSGEEGDTSPNSAWEAIVRQNMFVEQMLPQMVMTRQLTDVEKLNYGQPFELEESRKPVWKWPREIPIGGKTVEGSSFTHDAILSYRDWLSTSSIPKFYLYATPGALNLEDRDLPWIQGLPNIDVVPFGPGLHFLQEDNPHKIGQEINKWVDASF